jgi:hypothetical protein
MSSSDAERPGPEEARTLEESALEGADRGTDQAAERVLHSPGALTPASPAESDSNKRPTQSTELVELARTKWRVGRDAQGGSFAVPLEGPPIARRIGYGPASLGNELAAMYSKAFGKTPGRSAIVDAIAVLDGEAAQVEREPVFVRVGHHGGRVIIDRGAGLKPFVVISPGKFEETAESPVTFRRTDLTGVLPAPLVGGTPADLATLVNVSSSDFWLLWAWMVAAVLDIPLPILFLTGEQGTGKTRAAGTIARILDPSSVPVRSGPRDLDSWAVAASGCHVSALDNMSAIPEWLSDALCRASTGEGLVKRQLYTDSGLSVIHLRKPVIITSIDAGALRGDLGERLVMVELERIRSVDRLTDSSLEGHFERLHPVLFGVLCQLVAEVLKRLPSIHLTEMPRMADFSKVLAALDNALGWNALETYIGSLDRVASDVLAGDPLGQAIRLLVESYGGSWVGTMSDLLQGLEPYRTERTAFPKTPATLGNAIKRLAPALRSAGIEVDYGRSAGSRTTTFRLAPQPEAVAGMTAMTGREDLSSVARQEFSVEGTSGGASGAVMAVIPSQLVTSLPPRGLTSLDLSGTQAVA